VRTAKPQERASHTAEHEARSCGCSLRAVLQDHKSKQQQTQAQRTALSPDQRHKWWPPVSLGAPPKPQTGATSTEMATNWPPSVQLEAVPRGQRRGWSVSWLPGRRSTQTANSNSISISPTRDPFPFPFPEIRFLVFLGVRLRRKCSVLLAAFAAFANSPSSACERRPIGQLRAAPTRRLIDGGVRSLSEAMWRNIKGSDNRFAAGRPAAA